MMTYHQFNAQFHKLRKSYSCISQMSLSFCATFISSLLTCLGQYLLFFTSAEAKAPFFFKEMRPCRTQKTESRITTFPV